jgi:hypothetical protein
VRDANQVGVIRQQRRVNIQRREGLRRGRLLGGALRFHLERDIVAAAGNLGRIFCWSSAAILGF